MTARPTYNDQLPFIREGWQGNALDEKGRYRNSGSFKEWGWDAVWRWQTGPKPFKAQKKADKWRPEQVQMHDSTSWPENGIAWLGHATFLIRLDGLTLITDPVLGNVSLMKRMTPLPVRIQDLQDIDVLLMSHNHRDHCDLPSIRRLASQNPDLVSYTGLEMTSLLRSGGLKTNAITTAGWYQSYPAIGDVRIHYLPSKHWTRRYLRDTNTMLWGSFIIQTPQLTIYFGGDSGYDQHFKEIGSMFPSIDLALLGVGAYEPRWFMKDSHTAPEEAAQAADDLGARWWIPMHFGTFDLADEPISQPLELLRKRDVILNNGSIPITQNDAGRNEDMPIASRWVLPAIGRWMQLDHGEPIGI